MPFMHHGFVSPRYGGEPLGSDMKHSMVVTMSGAKKEVGAFAPMGVTFDEIFKVMEPERDIRYVRPTSEKDKWVFYPVNMHEKHCSCDSCKIQRISL